MKDRDVGGKLAAVRRPVHALHVEAGKRTTRPGGLQQRADLADHVPPQPFLERCGGCNPIRPRGAALVGGRIRHRERRVACGVEGLQRLQVLGRIGDRDPRVAVLHEVVVRHAPGEGEVIAAADVPDFDDDVAAEAGRVSGAPQHDARGVRRAWRLHHHAAVGGPVVDAGAAADEELLFDVARLGQIDDDLQLVRGHQRIGVGGDRNRPGHRWQRHWSRGLGRRRSGDPDREQSEQQRGRLH